MANDSAQTGVGTAFAIVCCAGLSTGIGASVVFIPRLVGLANHKVLAASLGGSAGVMLYLSFVEMFSEANRRFVAAGHGKGASFFYTTMSFFSGVLLISVRAVALTPCHNVPK
jgi:zinc transporter, ZIP family